MCIFNVGMILYSGKAVALSDGGWHFRNEKTWWHYTEGRVNSLTLTSAPSAGDALVLGEIL